MIPLFVFTSLCLKKKKCKVQALPLRMESHNILFDDLKRKSKSKSKVALTQMDSREPQAKGLLDSSLRYDLEILS